MTNTTRQLTFHSDDGSILLRAATPAPYALPPGGGRYALSITVGTDDVGRMLTADQVEELHELTGLILKGDDRVVDAEILCGAKIGDYECCLMDGHNPVERMYPHITTAGHKFHTGDLPF